MTRGNTIKRWLTYFCYIIGIVIFLLGLGLVAANFAQTRRNTDAIEDNTSATADLVGQLQQSVIDLKNDNKDQTLILCTIILNNAIDISSEKVTEVESICKEKIKQVQDGAAQSSPPAGTVQSSQPASSNPAELPRTNGNNGGQNNKPPDNDGFIITLPDDVPALPKQIHIPSPL